MTVEQKLDMLIEMLAHMNEQMTMQFGEMHEKSAQMDKCYRYDELNVKDAELERVQREQSADIMALRAAI